LRVLLLLVLLQLGLLAADHLKKAVLHFIEANG
jgi:hypothetical protein